MKSFMFALLAIGGLGGVAQAQVPGAQCVNRDDGSSICVNDRVLDYRDAAGTVTAIYSDLTAVVAYDSGDSNTVDLQYLAREVGCIYGYCAGDEVIDNSNDNVEGAISDLYENGMAEITTDDGDSYYYVEVNSLTSIAGENTPVEYGWAPPRPFPDLTEYHCFFPAPYGDPYAWPDGYPYPHPVIGRILHGIFPMPPQHFGFNHFDPYPFQHPVQWHGGGHVDVEFGNRHPVFGQGAGQGRPGDFNGHPGDGRPGDHGPGPGNGPNRGNGPGRGPVAPQPPRQPDPRPQPAPHPQPPRQPDPRPSPVPGPYNPGGNNGGGHSPSPAPRPAPDPRPAPAPGGNGGAHGGPVGPIGGPRR